MGNALDRCTDGQRGRALEELGEELDEFSHDGLTQLLIDLDEGTVLRGSWAGCVISYKRGAPGSTRRDRQGRARNPFTQLWDAGWITDEEVAGAVAREIAGRVASGRRPERGADGGRLTVPALEAILERPGPTS